VRAAIPLSLFWLVGMGALGLIFPFYSLYLNENLGLAPSQVGMVMAILPLTGMFAQPGWGQVADITGRREAMLGFLCLAAAMVYGVLGRVDGFVAALLITSLLAAFSTAVIPMAVATTLAAVRPLGPHAFGLVRVWGTIGFFITVVGLPRLLDFVGGKGWNFAWLGVKPVTATEPLLGLMFPLAGLFLLTAAVITLTLPRTHATSQRASRGEWRLLLRHKPFVRLLIFCFFSYFFLQGPMALFPLYVRSIGGGVETVSNMWVFMLILEVPLVALAGTGLVRMGARGLVAVGITAGAVRWLVCGIATDLNVVYAIQVLHGVTVTGLMLGAPLYVDAAVPARLHATAQGMLAMVGISLGGVLSNLAAGALAEWAGPQAPALYGGIGATLLALSLPFVLPKPSPVLEAPTEPVVGVDSFPPQI
jgi:PPP family 3-phenylpropionic acid transporter